MRFFLSLDQSEDSCTLALENFRKLRRQIPLLYATALVNIVGLHIATRGEELAVLSIQTFLTAFVVWRMIHWIFFERDIVDFEVAYKKMGDLVIFTIFLCTGFLFWTQSLVSTYPEELMIIALFSILAALGATYSLSSFPLLAMMPVAIIGLPVAGRLLFQDKPSMVGIGVSLLFALLLLMRLLYTHSHALTELAGSRLQAARERHRAKEAEIDALQRAEQDSLTGLANRGKLMRELSDKMVQGLGAGSGSVLALGDLDGFKAANDAFGHAAGDTILKTFGSRLQEAFGNAALVARTGGDEFAIFWPDGLSAQDIENAGHKICDLASTPVEWEGKWLHVSASCGFTEAGPLSHSVSEFLRQADSALYHAKAAGKSAWQFYDLELLAADQRRAGLEKLLIEGTSRDELRIMFQPIVSLSSGKTVYGEALARWTSQALGEVSPSEFISIAEQMGAISDFNDMLLRKATSRARLWPLDLGLSFNLSALQISRPGTALRLLHLLAEEGFSPSRVQFEVAETAFATELATAKKELQALREAGSTIALDNFGAGHASISSLRDLVFDVIKLDGSLTADIQHCERSRGILLGLIDLCHAAGAKCVAEHVETQDQLTLIRAMGCDFAQGYFLGMPTCGIPTFGPVAEQDGRSFRQSNLG